LNKEYEDEHGDQNLDESSAANNDDIMSFSGIQICAFDNRGVGKSSAPQSKSEYT
jgi:hypothetical protein